MNKVYLAPSFYAHIINGILLLIGLILLFKNYSNIIKLEPYKILFLVLLLSIAVGIHGILHLGLEKNYNFNSLIQL